MASTFVLKGNARVYCDDVHVCPTRSALLPSEADSKDKCHSYLRLHGPYLRGGIGGVNSRLGLVGVSPYKPPAERGIAKKPLIVLVTLLSGQPRNHINRREEPDPRKALM